MEPEELAKQLKKPEGDLGIKVANNMNKGNAGMYQLTMEALNITDHEKILEIGFGNGKHIKDLVSNKKNIFYAGIDISSTMVAEAIMCNKQLIENDSIEIQQASVSSIPYMDNFFDKVFTINTLYFWEHPESDMKEIFRVLKKGGSLFLSIRPKNSVINLAFTKFGFRLYEPEEAENLLSNAGFKNISFTFQQDPPVKFMEEEVIFQSMCIKGVK